MKATDYIAKHLKNYGIRHFFGFQGGAITPLIDALVNNGIEYIQNYHEQASGFSADAYARITNKLGVVLVTNGPGVTNVVSSIANAFFDSSPVLFITGQVKTSDINISSAVRQNGFQEVDTISLVTHITKYAVTIKDIENIKYEFDKAIEIATTGRKGPVVLSLPLDIQQKDMDGGYVREYCSQKNKEIKDYQIKDIVALINNSRKPLIINGGGVQISGAFKLLETFSKITRIPSVSTLMGLDVVTSLNGGFSGLYGHTYANLAVYNADLLLVFGSRLTKRQIVSKEKYNRNGKIIQIDIDKFELARNIPSDIVVNADLYDFLDGFNTFIKQNNVKFRNFSSWYEKLVYWKDKYYNNCCLNNDCLDPVRFLREVSQLVDENSIICSDVGQNQMWTAQGFEFKAGQRFLTSGGLGCMGFSLPASIGAKITASEKNVIAFMGDGGLQMNMQELQLISQLRLPIKIFIFNNNSLGMIQEAQTFYFNSRYYGTRIGYHAPNIKLLADVYAIEYVQIKTMSDIDKIQNIINSSLPYIVEIFLQQNQTLLLNRFQEENIYEQDIF
jgi:acetolactate synthase-1/2/3 large subunit